MSLAYLYPPHYGRLTLSHFPDGILSEPGGVLMSRDMVETVAAAAIRKHLSSSRFQKMCREAARHSNGCREYVCGVLTRLCRWLDIPDRTESLRLECELGDGNVQRVVLSLYRLLDEKCLYDFDVQSILNSYSAGEQ